MEHRRTIVFLNRIVTDCRDYQGVEEVEVVVEEEAGIVAEAG